jgi:hypothetical protein
MLEPVGLKQQTWYINQSLKCPTEEYPYIFTSKNSAKALEELKRKNTTQPTSNTSIIPDANSTSSINTTDNSTSAISTGNYTYMSTTTFQPNSTSIRNSSNHLSTIDVNTTAVHRRKHHYKDKKEKKSDSSLNNTKLVAIVGFSFIIIMILIVGIMRRRKQFTLISQPRNVIIQKVNKFNRLNEESDDDVDVYTQPNASKSGYSDKKIPTTHGTRMPLD